MKAMQTFKIDDSVIPFFVTKSIGLEKYLTPFRQTNSTLYNAFSLVMQKIGYNMLRTHQGWF